jgi:hypothetical protein
MKNKKLQINKETIRRYLENRMSVTERNRFERELQKHPFDAEAFDGFEQLSPGWLQNDLKELKNRIHRSQRKNNYRWWAAAASFLLLVTAGIFLFQLNQEDTMPEISELETTRLKQGQDKEQEPVQQPESDEIQIDTGEITPVGKTKKAVKDKTAIPYEKKENKLIAGAVEKTAEAVEESTGIVVINDNRSAAKSGSDIHFNPDSIKEWQKSALLPQKTALSIDKNDIFPDSFKNLPMQEREKVQVVSGITEQDKVITEKKVQLQDAVAQPEGGMAEFKRYLERQAVLPKGSGNTATTVNLMIKLDDEGKITGIENLNKSDAALFEQAKKIIRNGPGWKPQILNGQPVPAKVMLKIVFKKNSPE